MLGTFENCGYRRVSEGLQRSEMRSDREQGPDDVDSYRLLGRLWFLFSMEWEDFDLT